tara:strand:+ start:2118 stop:5867 length:3750 start_codon:yes stop_codon:yes gene_type:complete
MNFEDLNKESLGLQKIPFPVIESIVLNDEDGISLDIRYSIYAPVLNGKDVFEQYKDFLTVFPVIMTRDVSDETLQALSTGEIKKKGAFLNLEGKSLITSPVYGGFSFFNPSLVESNRFGDPGFFKPDEALLFSTPELGEVRKYQFSSTFKNLKMTERQVFLDDRGKVQTNIKVIADDRIIDLSGFIEITADLTKVSLPFPTKASKLTYAFPFTIARNGEVNFTFQALQTNQQEIWAGAFTTEFDEDTGETTIKKLPLDEEDPNLQFVAIQDSSIISNFVGVNSGKYFQIDLEEGPLSVQGAFDKLGNQLLYSRKFATALGDYFSSKKLEKIASPVSPVFSWGTNKKNSVNLAFEFDVKKFLNGDAFQYSGMAINAYEDNIKSIEILRRKVPKNIDERFTEDFLDKKILNVPKSVIKQAIAEGSRYIADFKDVTTLEANSRLAVYRADDNNLRLLFVMKDMTVENMYDYKYSIRVTYDSKRLTALNNYFDSVLPALSKFEALEPIIVMSKYYDPSFERMTDEFKTEFKPLFEQVKSVFTDYYTYLGAVVKAPEAKDFTSEQIFTQLYDEVVKTLLVLIDIDTILPSTYLILKDSLRASIEQGKKFLRDPSLNKKPKNKDSKPPKAPEKTYELSGVVSVEGFNNVSLNYLEKGKPTEFDTAPEIAPTQIENLFQLEYAKYYGEANTLRDIDFTRKTFTPVTINFNDQVIETLDQTNLFNPPPNQNVTSLVLSIADSEEINYVQNTGKNDPTKLLQSLLGANISVIDSTNSGKFQNTDDISKMSFADFFGGGDPFNKSDQYKSIYTKKKENYQDLQNLTSQYSLLQTIGQEEFVSTLQKLLTTNGITSLNKFDLPPALFALKMNPPQDTGSPYFIDLQTHIASILNVAGANAPDDFAKTVFAIMVLTNVVQIEVLQNGEWLPYKGISGIQGAYVLARFNFIKDDLVVNLPQLKATIINQYFVLDTGKMSDFTIFELPNNKNPQKKQTAVIPNSFDTSAKDTGKKQTVGLKPTALEGFDKESFLGSSIADKFAAADAQRVKKEVALTRAALTTGIQTPGLGKLVGIDLDAIKPTRLEEQSAQASGRSKPTRLEIQSAQAAVEDDDRDLNRVPIRNTEVEPTVTAPRKSRKLPIRKVKSGFQPVKSTKTDRTPIAPNPNATEPPTVIPAEKVATKPVPAGKKAKTEAQKPATVQQIATAKTTTKKAVATEVASKAMEAAVAAAPVTKSTETEKKKKQNIGNQVYNPFASFFFKN